MARTYYRWMDGDIGIVSTDADSAQQASEAGRNVTAVTVA